MGAYFLRDYLNEIFILPLGEMIQMAIVLSFFWVVAFILLGLYRIRVKRRSLEELVGVMVGATAAATVSGAVIFLLREISFSRLVFLLTWLLSMILVWWGRVGVGLVQEYLYRRGIGVRKVLIIGASSYAVTVLRGILAERDMALQVVGVISDDIKKNARIEGAKVLGKTVEVKKLIEVAGPDEIIQADPTLPRELFKQIVGLCETHGIRFKFIPNLYYEVSAPRIATYDLAGLPVVEVSSSTLDGWTLILKRIMDVVVAVLALLLTAPLLFLTAVAIKLDSPGTIIFPHERVGRNGKRFKLYKFRSMHMIKQEGKWVHAEKDKIIEKLKEQQKNYKLEGDPRITRVGAIIRKTSIDELPQFLNVLKGEMSVVGPRAYMEKELAKQREVFPQTKELVRKLLTVKPGITGIWQVSGRSNVEFSERVGMDAYYATHANLWLDLKIMLQTLPVVLRGSGAM